MSLKKDLTGQKFGRLTVLYEISKEQRKYKKKAEWECECECGNHIHATTESLTSGNTKSCGCLRKDHGWKVRLDITGKRFGRLVALQPTEERRSEGVVWKCRCDCGTICYTTVSELNRRTTRSCGCLRSSGEGKINKILFENNINYTTQFWFDDLKDKKHLYFDFAILNDDKSIKCLIEFQGEQHYRETGFFINESYPNLSYLEYIQKHDDMKRDYCKQHNIKLIEISYEHEKDLNYEYLTSLINN